MQPAAPLDYHAPCPLPPRWFGLAAAGLALHWVLFFAWGLALNDVANGYIYCRLALPDDLDFRSSEWVFSAAALAVLAVCGIIDRTKFGVSRRGAIYPAALFVLTQLFAVWLSISSRRY
jgi:hypothetical protein